MDYARRAFLAMPFVVVAVGAGPAYAVSAAPQQLPAGRADTLSLVLRWLLGAVLLLAAVPKLRARREYRQVVGAYRIVPARLAWPVAGAVLAAEVGIGVALLSGRAEREVGLAAAALFAGFSVALLVQLASRGEAVPCGCFGMAESEPVSGASLVRALVLVGAAATVAVRGPSAEPADGRVLVLAGTVALGGALVLRLLSGLPEAWSWWRAPARTIPTPTRRRSWKYEPLTSSLHPAEGIARPDEAHPRSGLAHAE